MRENSSRNQDGLKYQKLYNWGRTLIMSGVLRNMDKFPSEHMLQNKLIEAFKGCLESKGINVTIRREMGRDIDGACGQLRKSYMDKEQEKEGAAVK